MENIKGLENAKQYADDILLKSYEKITDMYEEGTLYDYIKDNMDTVTFARDDHAFDDVFYSYKYPQASGKVKEHKKPFIEITVYVSYEDTPEDYLDRTLDISSFRVRDPESRRSIINDMKEERNKAKKISQQKTDKLSYKKTYRIIDNQIAEVIEKAFKDREY